MNNYRFIVSIFGEKHVGMLLSNLYAISKNAPLALVSVFWQDIDSGIKKDFITAFPKVDFQDTNFDLDSDKIRRISSKMLFWNHAAKMFKNQNLCFIDVDTLVLKDVSEFFNNEFDVLFTYKEGMFPLNTGVILCKGDNCDTFFQEWLRVTLEILRDEKLLQKAMSTKYPYGGGDQMALYTMLRYEINVDRYEIIIDNKKIIAKRAPCSVLNETRSTHISDNLHIVHYKGGWQMILLEGEGFTRNRPKKKSWEMYLLYLKTYKMALEYLNKSSGKKYTFESFGIKIPFYLNPSDFTENKFKYALFAAVSNFESILAKTREIMKI